MYGVDSSIYTAGPANGLPSSEKSEVDEGRKRVERLRSSSEWDRNPDPPWRWFSDEERTVPKSVTWLLREFISSSFV